MTTSYGSLSDQVDRLAARLRQSGLDPGQVVAIALPNGIEYLVAFLAARYWLYTVQPLLIAVIGGVILMVALAIILPILNIYNSIGVRR